MDISYDYYRVFYYAARYRSFSRAAEALLSNQPNVTKFMNNLEAQLGCRLFVRSNRGVTLTPEGEKLYARVAVAFEQLSKAEQELAGERRLDGGVVTIGASEMALHGMLLPALKAFHERHPAVRLRISNDSSQQAVQALRSGAVDFSVVTSPVEVPKPLKARALRRYREILVTGPQYAFLAARPRRLEELECAPLVGLGRNTKTYDFYAELFLKHRLTLRLDTEAATADQLLPLIRNHLGVGFVPEMLAREAVEKGEVFEIPLTEPIPEREILLVEDGSRPLSIAAERLRQMMEEGRR